MPDYVSATDAAKNLNRSESFIRRRIKTGEITARKVNGRWAVDLCELDEFRADPSDEPSTISDEPRRIVDGWRDDLLAQVARLEADVAQRDADKDAMREDFDTRLAEQRQEAGLRVEASKARVIDLERELTVRDSLNVDLREQVSVLEAKVRSTLEERAEENGQLANRIADLVAAHTEVQSRVIELQPVADQVPMLQAAVGEKDATLSEREQALQDTEQELGNMRQDIDAIASRPVTGPVFRLLTKGRLRR